jgi:hypothetical protein
VINFRGVVPVFIPVV